MRGAPDAAQLVEGLESAWLADWLGAVDLAGLGDPDELGRTAAGMVAAGAASLPLPGQGRTRERFAALAEIGAVDCGLARLLEGHADALAILAELTGGAPAAPELWGVWAAQPPGGRALRAARDGAGWRLSGEKPYCSGAGHCRWALVTAQADDGARLFAVELRPRGVEPLAGSWPAVGMAASDSRTVRFTRARAEAVGDVGAYLSRPGFWHGAAGVAACWYGGAVGVGRALRRAAARRELDPHAAAHLGRVDAEIAAMRASLWEVADEIDRDPSDEGGRARLLAGRVRATVEAGATSVLGHTGRALGAGPLVHDGAHARRVADLTVYLRQSHAERDLAAHGAEVLALEPDW